MSSRLLLLYLMLFLATASFVLVGTYDAGTWLRWTNVINQNGLVDGYALLAREHPPFLYILLLGSTKSASLVGLHAFYGLKFGLLFFLLFSAAIIYYWSLRDAVFTFCCYLSLLLSSLCLVYIDIFFCPFILLTFYFLAREKIGYAAFCFTLAAFIKYPPLIIAPFILIYLVELKLKNSPDTITGIKRLLITVVAPAALAIVPVFVFFGAEPIYALKRAFHHGMLSAQAYNFNWILTRIIQIFPGQEFSARGWHNNGDLIRVISSDYLTLSRVMVGVFYLSLLARFVTLPKNIETLLLYCVAAHMSYFIFSYCVHENHLFLSAILAIALACINPRFQSLAITIAIISSLNLIAFFGFNGTAPGIWPEWYFTRCATTMPVVNPICALSDAHKPYFDLGLLLAVFNVIYFLRLWTCLIFKNKISK